MNIYTSELACFAGITRTDTEAPEAPTDIPPEDTGAADTATAGHPYSPINSA
jgi:hypothetical protein